MSCKKHPQRKRKDCPDCFPDITKMKVKEHIDTIIVNKERAKKVIKEIAEKKPVKPKSKPVEVEQKPEIVVEKPTVEEKPIVKDKLTVFKEELDTIIKEAVVRLKREVASITNVQYEHLAIPDGAFNKELWDKLERQGWGYRDTYRGQVAKVSGYPCDVTIMVRVKNDKWPAAPVFKLKEK